MNSVYSEYFIKSKITACWYCTSIRMSYWLRYDVHTWDLMAQNVFQASFPPQNRLFFCYCFEQYQLEQDDLERYIRLGFLFRCKMTGRAEAKKDDFYIFQTYCFFPVDFCPSKPLHYQVIRQMEAKNRFIRLFTGINCPLSAISSCQTIVLRDPFIARW